MSEQKPFILYMDDDQDDKEILEEAIHAIDPSFLLLTASDGEEGLKQLRELKRNNTLPRLIVLDINMPGMDGRMTLQKMREDAELCRIPVVVLSTSSSELDKLFFQHKVVEYITKPVSYDHFIKVAQRLLTYVEHGT